MHQYTPDEHHRRSIRLRNYDYAQAGLYFITIVTQHRICLFGDVVGDTMRINDCGMMIQHYWDVLPIRFPAIRLDAYQIMPNHLHGIVEILEPAAFPNAMDDDKNLELGHMPGAFKSEVTTAYIRGVREQGWLPFDRKLLQRNYWEHVIRSNEEYQRLCWYMANNPDNWGSDSLRPA